MPRRSTTITIANPTDQDLTLIASHTCHGCWTNDIAPPQTIAKNSCASWEAESCGIGTGTEGWVKYQISNPVTGCVPELVFIYWDNPFAWRNDTKAIDFSVTTTDVTPVCDGDQGQWDPPGGFPHGGTNPSLCTHELFGISAGGSGAGGITWWDVAVNWPALIGFTVLGQEDINLEFIIGLRDKGSLRQTVNSGVSCVGPKDIGALVREKGQPSLRALFHM